MMRPNVRNRPKEASELGVRIPAYIRRGDIRTRRVRTTRLPRLRLTATALIVRTRHGVRPATKSPVLLKAKQRCGLFEARRSTSRGLESPTSASGLFACD